MGMVPVVPAKSTHVEYRHAGYSQQLVFCLFCGGEESIGEQAIETPVFSPVWCENYELGWRC